MMCGRYTLEPGESQEIEAIVRQVQEQIKTGEIFPTNPVPILMAAAGELTPQPALWGFPHFRGSGVIINARSETAMEKAMFRKSLLGRRCALPTTGFFEWGPGTQGKKQKYRFNLPGSKALYLAGLWNEFAGERRCVILTTEANTSMSGIHNRMPVILNRMGLEAWTRNPEVALEVIRQEPPALEFAAVPSQAV